MPSSRLLTLLVPVEFLLVSVVSLPALGDIGEILSLERRVHAHARAVNRPSGTLVEDEQTEVAPDRGVWAAAAVSNARASEAESVSFVSTAYQNSRGSFVPGRSVFQAQGWATADTVRVEPLIPGESLARSVYDLTFRLNFLREVDIRGLLRSESQPNQPPEGGALFVLTGERGEVFRRQVGSNTETLNLSYEGLLEPGTYRILVRANRGGGRQVTERLGIGRSSFDVTVSFQARPLRLTSSPLIRGQQATFSVRDADPDIEVKLFATKNGLCGPLFCNPTVPFNSPIIVVEGMSDGSGSVDFSVRVPRMISSSVIHCLAIQRRPRPNGIFSTSSDVVEIPVSR